MVGLGSFRVGLSFIWGWYLGVAYVGLLMLGWFSVTFGLVQNLFKVYQGLV
jgi:hypothetical protein